MNINEIKASLKEGTIQESKKEKYALQVVAAENLAKDMRKIVQGAALNKKLRDFLESDEFVNTLYNIIYHANTAVVDSQKHLSSKDLKPLKNKKATISQLLSVCEKLRIGMQDILSNSEELDYNTILFQGLFIYYTDNLTHKLEVANNKNTTI